MAQRRPPRHWVILNLDHFRFDQTYGGTVPPDRIGDAPGDYGNRVGAWRIMEVLDKYGMRATAAVNGEVCEFDLTAIIADCS